MQRVPTIISTTALIFDMDGTMIDSMPYHTQSWIEFCKRHGITMDVQDLLHRTTGRTGTECLGLKMGVGTAGNKHNIAFTLGHLKMAHAPDVVVGGDQGLAGKPDHAIFLEAACALSVRPNDCIAFEDAPFGIEAARRAGMRAVAICTSHTAKQLAGPHVLAAVPDYHARLDSQFLASL
jgi:beta-phosphoglucomutase-like phosphatase (HAD superfamily)